MALENGAQGAPRGWRRFVEPILSIGAFPGESVTRRSGRRVMIMASVVASVLSIPTVLFSLGDGFVWDAVLTSVLVAATPCLLLVSWRRPRAFVPLLNGVFGLVILVQCAEAALFGGLWLSALAPVFGIIVVLGAMIVMPIRTAVCWLTAYAASVLFAVEVPHWVDPVYARADPGPQAAFALIATGLVAFAIVAYFVRQRDRFQEQSDALLRNVLPDEIAERLKRSSGTIAQDFPEASVLFADLAGFTPMSAAMSPGEVVELLDDVFRTFDRFVAELGLEKIKTVGDEYMAAAGVPLPRPDHAAATAELAVRVRDHFAANDVRGRRLSFRIGINSGPVTAGIIGTHKFAYDLWGDTVNAASRMESTGVPGSIQISATTRALIQDTYVCEPLGTVAVKGKGEMETFALVGRRGDRADDPSGVDEEPGAVHEPRS
jgi:adenylate cyclase